LRFYWVEATLYLVFCLSPSALNPAQKSVIDHSLLDSGFSCVLQMPTGSGKTWLAKEAIRHSVNRGFRAVYLSPLRALADELATRWATDFPDTPIGVFTGDYGGTGKAHPVSYQKARVLIMTPERLDACTRSWRSHWSWIPEVDWIVVDEIHLLGDKGRGARMEGALSRFRRLNPFCRVLGLSATMGNRGELADWLEGVEFHSEWRPVPLDWRVVHYKKAEEKPSLLARELSRNRATGGQSLVFVQSRRRSESLAAFLRDQGLNALHHHAGLDHSRRRSVETAFRQNSTPILVATGTLEMGLNLPARQVVLYDTQGFDGSEFSPLAVNTVWQRAGRAGRPGLDTVGEALLLSPSWDKAAEHYPRGHFERIESGLSDSLSLSEQILAEVHSGMSRSSIQLERVFQSSLAHLQGKPLCVEECIGEMLSAGMLASDQKDSLEEGEDRLKATPLGRIAVRQLLRPSTILSLKKFLAHEVRFTAFDLLVAAVCTTDCEPVLSVDFEELDRLSQKLAAIPSVLCSCPKSQWQRRLPVSGKRLLSAIKAAALLLDWTRSGDTETLAEENGCYPFEITRLVESMDRLLMAAGAVHKLYHSTSQPVDGGPEESDYLDPGIGLLRQMVINGVEDSAAALTLIDGIGSKWARKLVASGICDLHQLASSPPARITKLGGVSEKRATLWIENAGKLLSDPFPHSLPTDAPFIQTGPTSMEGGVDPYRLRRALELSVISVSRQKWTVSGGLEPHQIEEGDAGLLCDCLDHKKGNLCKHALAVRIQQQDPLVASALEQLAHATETDSLDLFILWFNRSNP
jgi:helicase